MTAKDSRVFDRIDHIAIAVESLDDTIALYEKTFGLPVSHRELVADFNVEIATIEVGETAIEFLEGKSDDSPIRKFIQKRGPGIHHIAYVVEDIEQALAKLRAQGVQLIDEKPRRGKENSLVAFIHPASTAKVLYELVQLADL